MMAPLVRRTRAPRGRTPALIQKCRTREKVSVLAALGLSPKRDRLDLYFQTPADDYFDNWSVSGFLEAMVRSLTGRFVVVWDGGGTHKGDPIRDLVDKFGDRLTLEWLPPYAPELNPVEFLWSWLKYSQLNNFAPRDAVELDERVIAELTAIRGDQMLLQSFIRASDLPLRLTLLS